MRRECRSTEKAAFRRELEDLFDFGEGTETDGVEDDLHTVAREILEHFGLHQQVELFVSSADGLAILANCCNAAAKRYDDALYAHKPDLINAATAQHPECWAAEGIVYIETALGQVSFHALYGEDEGLPEAQGRVWSGLEYQMNADIVAQAFVEGWSKAELIEKIAEKCATSEELVA